MLLLLFLLVSVYAFVIELAPFAYRDPRALSLGGITVFGIPGIHTLHSNPAAFSQDDDVLYTLVSAVPHISMQPNMLSSLGDLSESDILKAGDSGLGLGMNLGMGLTGKGVGLGVLGSIMNWNDFSLGMTVRDAGNTVLAVSRPVDVSEGMDKLFTLSGFSLEEGSADTLTVPMIIDAGLHYSFGKPLVWGLQPDIYLEIGDILHTPKGLEILENLRGGIEFTAPVPVAIRTGYNAGGLSLGLGCQLPILNIDISCYRMPAVDGAEEGRHGFALEGRIEF
ncbi:hypothetical protein [Marispirochaeta sp.]|jgi:hypothetical protein|uniref:hypothetical protein n=1 Tax=Marispirochaeta sp. TaxID=2038653 RepID=UPI0029C5FF05|nr:hypothetical protein [Marispirochaeta sp.]